MSNEERFEQLINELELIIKDLGVATAYGYAVEKGYEGTEEEFAELMADYAHVAQDAEASAAAAKESEDNAKVSETNAKTSEDNAKESEDNAKVSETNADESETNAKQSELNADAYAKQSESWAVGTVNGSPVGQTHPAYHNNSKYYAEQAGTKAQEAAASEAIATQKASEASASETVATQKASEALVSAAEAKTSEDNAKLSENTASNAAVSALNSRDSAAESATTASGAATTATQKATEAGESATTASGAASTATQKATEASQSATSASGSATTATQKATEASNSASAAAQSAAEAEEAATHVADMALMQAIAPKYDSTVQYKIGNLLTYLGKQYYCIADAPAGTLPTNTAYFEEKSVADIIEMIKNGSIQVGSSKEADSLKTSVGVTDNTPFSAETAGGDSDITTGYQNLNKLVGCKVVKNQLVANNGFSSVSDWQTIGASYSVSSGEATITSTGEGGGSIFQNLNLIANHKYFFSAAAKVVSGGTANLTFIGIAQKSFTNTSYETFYGFATPNAEDVTVANKKRFFLGLNSDTNIGYYKNSFVIDLTQRYGNNDVVNAILGNGTDAEKVANLLAFDPNILKDTDYDTGSFSMCKSASLESVERNQWDEVAESGAIDLTTGANQSVSGYFRSKNYIRCQGGKTYYSTSPNAIYICLYDANKNFISPASNNNTPFIVPQNAQFMRFYTSGSTYENNICIQLYWDGSALGYVPYKRHFYPMPNVDLNGILKVVNGKVVADGDELTPDGSENKKRYVLVDLETLEWTYQSDSGSYRSPRIVVGAKTSGSVRATKYMQTTAQGALTNGIYVGNSNIVVFANASPTGYAIMELAEEESLSADTFSRNVYMDDFGFISFLDENGNVIDGLQGNEILYKANVSGFAESLYVRADGDPEYFAPAEDLTDEALQARGYYKMVDMEATQTEVDSVVSTLIDF